MCQSNLLPNIYSHTEQDSSRSPKHWTSRLTKRQKEKKNPILKEILSRCIEAGKSPRISRYGVKTSLWLWADNALPLLNTGFICDRSRKVFQRCTAGCVSPEQWIRQYGLFTAFKPLQQRNETRFVPPISPLEFKVHAWQRIYHLIWAQCTPEF